MKEPNYKPNQKRIPVNKITAYPTGDTYSVLGREEFRVTVKASGYEYQLWHLKRSEPHEIIWMVVRRLSGNAWAIIHQGGPNSGAELETLFNELANEDEQQMTAREKLALEWRKLDRRQQADPSFTDTTLLYQFHPWALTSNSPMSDPQTVGGDYARRHFGKVVVA